jgi:hypothetical protein
MNFNKLQYVASVGSIVAILFILYRILILRMTLNFIHIYHIYVCLELTCVSRLLHYEIISTRLFHPHKTCSEQHGLK